MSDDFDVLVRQALAIEDLDDDERWRIVRRLQERTDRVALGAACRLARSAARDERILGLDILSQLGVKAVDGSQAELERSRTFVAETVPLVLTAMSDEDSDVIGSAIAAAGHLRDTRLLAAALRHDRHPSAEIRQLVAYAVPFVAGDPPAPEAVETLIQLSGDPASDVRDWATFALGSILDVDSEPLRDALAARLDDTEGDTAGEALLGLARRHDPRALSPLLARLSDEPGNLIVEAAAELAAPEALSALLLLKRDGWPNNESEATMLEEAIRASSKGAALNS